MGAGPASGSGKSGEKGRGHQGKGVSWREGAWPSERRSMATRGRGRELEGRGMATRERGRELEGKGVATRERGHGLEGRAVAALPSSEAAGLPGSQGGPLPHFPALMCALCVLLIAAEP